MSSPSSFQTEDLKSSPDIEVNRVIQRASKGFELVSALRKD